MEDKIKEIMAQVFNIDKELIGSDSSLDTIEEWDSLSHSSLVIALEQGFDISFEIEEIIDMMSFEIIFLTLKEKVS